MRLFLYGTLMGDAATPMARWLADRVRTAIPAVAPGRMIAIPSSSGWFPAMLPGTGQISGISAEIDLAPGDLARLDRYEGREYRRVAIRVRRRCDHAPNTATAQAYLWRATVPDRARTVPGGDFLAWLDQVGAPILASRNGR